MAVGSGAMQTEDLHRRLSQEAASNGAVDPELEADHLLNQIAKICILSVDWRWIQSVAMDMRGALALGADDITRDAIWAMLWYWKTPSTEAIAKTGVLKLQSFRSHTLEDYARIADGFYIGLLRLSLGALLFAAAAISVAACARGWIVHGDVSVGAISFCLLLTAVMIFAASTALTFGGARFLLPVWTLALAAILNGADAFRLRVRLESDAGPA